MCRFIAYLGKKIFLEDILLKPENSLLAQSLHARESHMPTNGDGFGLAWYTPLTTKAGLFTAITPAWNNRNLKHLAKHIQSTCFFAHVRAASAGGITEYNCHPFVHHQYTFMHNGGIANFYNLKRHLRSLLNDELYHVVKGETDSEHIFALYLQHLKNIGEPSNLSNMQQALLKTLKQILALSKKYGLSDHPSFLNLCVTNGQQIVACRMTDGPLEAARTLHWLKDENAGTVVIASEVLNTQNPHWQEFPANHIIAIDYNLKTTLSEIYL